MKARNAFLTGAFAVLALVSAACSGGGHSGVPTVHPSGSAPATTVKVRVSLLIPKRSANARRARAYVSYATQSAQISINGTVAAVFATSEGSSNCTFTEGGGTCSADVAAPIGTDSFTLGAYAGAVTSGGAVSGALLSTGTAMQPIVAGTANTVNLTLDGVVASLQIYGQGVPAGTATTVPVFVNALDATQNVIVGPGGYSDASGNPVTIALTDTDAATTTSFVSGTTALTDPSQNGLLHYNGTPPHGTLPVLSANAGSTALSVSVAFPITPVLQLVSSAFSSAPEAMTLAGDGKTAHLLETPPSTGPKMPIVASVLLTGSGAGTPQEVTYQADCQSTSVLALAPAIATDPSTGDAFFSDQPSCGFSSEIVQFFGGSFTGNPIDDPGYDNVGVATALAFTSPGSALLVADVEPGYAIDARRRSGRLTVAPSASPSASPSPAASASATPTYSPYGTSVVITGTNGVASTYTLASSLGLSTSDTYTFGGVPNANVITVDASGEAWFPETITDTTTNTTQGVLIEADQTKATMYAPPVASGYTEQIVAIDAASDGNIWYIANQYGSNTVNEVAGHFSPSAKTFTQSSFGSTSPPVPLTGTSLVEGADKALYTVANASILRIAESDGSIEGFQLSGSGISTFAAGLATSTHDVYFAGPALYHMLY